MEAFPPNQPPSFVLDSRAAAAAATATAATATSLGAMFAHTSAQDDEALIGLGALGAADGCAEQGFLTSLDPGGSLMSAGGGGWSISTLPGEEGLRWSGVKTEEVFDEWASSGGGRQQARMADLLLQPSPLLAAGKGSSNLKLVGQARSDTEEGWKDFVGPPPTALPCSGKAGSDTNSPPSFPPPFFPETAEKVKGIIKPSAARPTTIAIHSAGSSTKDNIAAFTQQRSSPHGPTTLTSATATTTPAAPARTTTTTATITTTAPPPPRATATTAATPAPRTAATTVTTRTRARTSAAAADTTTATLVKLEPTQEEDDEGENDDDDDATATATAAATTRRTNAIKNGHIIKSDSDDDFDDLDLDGPTGSELTDKRRRNREHAKRSRLRKRVRLGGLEEMVLGLRRENVRLRRMVMCGIPDRAAAIIRTCAKDNTNADTVSKQDVVQGMRPGMSLGSSASSWSAGGRGGSRTRPKLEITESDDVGVDHRGGGGGGGTSSSAGKDRRVPSALKLMSPSYQTVKALADSQANFILTNPNLPDCPIIFASQGFLELTGYEGKDVIGRNCRFLQGPGTDPVALSIIRNNVAAGRDTSVCVLNYKKDGTPFWNQLSIGVLLDAHGQAANHVGVAYEVNPMPPALFHRLLHRVPLPESLLHIDSGSDGEDDPVGDSKVSAAEFGPYGSSGASGGGITSCAISGDGSAAARSGTATAPRVVDRLRRTRAAAAISSSTALPEGNIAT